MPLEGEFIISDKKDGTEKLKQSPVNIKQPDKEIPVKQHRPGPFTTFLQNPAGVTFESQEEDETILLLIRRHFITNLPWILMLILLALIPLVLVPALPFVAPSLNISSQTETAIILFYYLVLFGILLVNFSIWYFNVALLTNKRLVDVDIYGILSRNVAETQLDLIQDVSYTQVGSIRSLFNYGDILVQTAGSLTNFEFDQAPHPARIVRIIGDLIGTIKK